MRNFGTHGNISQNWKKIFETKQVFIAFFDNLIFQIVLSWSNVLFPPRHSDCYCGNCPFMKTATVPSPLRMTATVAIKMFRKKQLTRPWQNNERQRPRGNEKYQVRITQK